MKRFLLVLSLATVIAFVSCASLSGIESLPPSPIPILPIGTLLSSPTPSPSVEARQMLTTTQAIELPSGPEPGDLWRYAPSMDWRPDGQALAYAGGGGVWLATAPDFTPQRLTERGIQPKWSLDGQRLATIWSEPEKGWVLQTIDLSENVLQEVDLGDEKSLVIDRWLDNERLTLVIHRGAPGEVLHEVSLTQQTMLPLVSPEGGTLSMVLGGRYHWSPAQKFLVVEWGFAVLPGRITVIDVDKRDETHLAQFGEGRYQQFESWAQDSTRFLYEQWEGVSNAPLIEGNTPPSLLVWDVAENRGREVLPNVWGAAWSPKDDQIAFLLLGNPNRDKRGNITGTDFIPGEPFALSIGVMDTATQAVKALVPLGQVTDVEAFVAGPFWCDWPRPVWSPDGSQIVYWDAQGRLWVMTPDGQVRWPLVESGEAVKYVAWSPDGSRLALRMTDRIMILTSRSLPQTSAAVVPTCSPEARASEYKDSWLCFTVEVPTGWTADGVPGGFALFMPGTDQNSFSITNVALEETTLAQALAEVKRGSLGAYIQEVKDFTVGGRPALWVTLSPDNPDSSGIKLVVLVIAPDCGDGSHALFISATGADQGSLEAFLNHVRFVQGDH